MSRSRFRSARGELALLAGVLALAALATASLAVSPGTPRSERPAPAVVFRQRGERTSPPRLDPPPRVKELSPPTGSSLPRSSPPSRARSTCAPPRARTSDGRIASLADLPLAPPVSDLSTMEGAEAEPDPVFDSGAEETAAP